MSEMREVVIDEEELRLYLKERLRLQGQCEESLEKINLPFMFSVGSELLRTFILSKSEFTSSLPDRLRLPQRGYIWHMFCQSVREVQVTPQRMVVKYEMMDDYRIPFQQFYL